MNIWTLFGATVVCLDSKIASGNLAQHDIYAVTMIRIEIDILLSFFHTLFLLLLQRNSCYRSNNVANRKKCTYFVFVINPIKKLWRTRNELKNSTQSLEIFALASVFSVYCVCLCRLVFSFHWLRSKNIIKTVCTSSFSVDVIFVCYNVSTFTQTRFRRSKIDVSCSHRANSSQFVW